MCMLCELMEGVPEFMQAKYKGIMEDLMRKKYGTLEITVREGKPTFTRDVRTKRYDYDRVTKADENSTEGEN